MQSNQVEQSFSQIITLNMAMFLLFIQELNMQEGFKVQQEDL